MATISPHYPPAAFDRDHAAAYMSISVRTLDEAQAAGELIPKRLGQKRLFLREDLEDFVRRLPDWERQRRS